MDSWRAGSMKAQVFTTTRSAWCTSAAARYPLRWRRPASLSLVNLVLRAPQGLQPVRLVSGRLRCACAHKLSSVPDRPTLAPASAGRRSCRALGASEPFFRESFQPGEPGGPWSPVTSATNHRRACQPAEREGFEPSDRVPPVNSLAVSPIRPLSHLSRVDRERRRAPRSPGGRDYSSSRGADGGLRPGPAGDRPTRSPGRPGRPQPSGPTLTHDRRNRDAPPGVSRLDGPAP